MNSKNYIFVAIIIVLVIIIAVTTKKTDTGPIVENQPLPPVVTTTPATTPAPTTPKPVVYTTPSKPASGYYQVHIIGGSPSVYYTPTTTVVDTIKVYNPPTNTSIRSPLTLSGLARGQWFFEATAPVILTDSKGKIIAQGHITPQSNSNTTDLVPFLGTLAFPAQPSNTKGVIVFKNDNPSGMASKDQAIEILVSF